MADNSNFSPNCLENTFFLFFYCIKKKKNVFPRNTIKGTFMYITIQNKSLEYAHQGCIFLAKNTVK